MTEIENRPYGSLHRDEEYRPKFAKPVPPERKERNRINPRSEKESSQLEDVADRLFYRLLLRRQNATCEAVGYGEYADGEPVKCRGRLDPAHGWSRRHHGTRWAHAGVHLLCRAHHDWFSARPGEWLRWRVQTLGVWLFEAVQRQAEATWRGSVQEVIDNLRRGVTQLERIA